MQINNIYAPNRWLAKHDDVALYITKTINRCHTSVSPASLSSEVICVSVCVCIYEQKQELVFQQEKKLGDVWRLAHKILWVMTLMSCVWVRSKLRSHLAHFDESQAPAPRGLSPCKFGDSGTKQASFIKKRIPLSDFLVVWQLLPNV